MGTWGWIALGVLAFLVLASSGKQKPKTAGRAEKNSERIDHLHYYDPDEYECPKCGARFTENVMTCPKCGTKFTGNVEDDEPYEEEYEMWDGDDDEDD